MDSKQILKQLDELQNNIHQNIKGEAHDQLDDLLKEAWDILFYLTKQQLIKETHPRAKGWVLFCCYILDITTSQLCE